MIYNGFTITKEYYADGPSLFVWVVRGGKHYPVEQEFRTRREAKQWIDLNMINN